MAPAKNQVVIIQETAPRYGELFFLIRQLIPVYDVADMDGDGMITVLDLRQMLRILSGIN